MLFNPGESEVLELGRVKQSLPTSYLLTGQKLSDIKQHKHLAVVISSKLSLSNHINEAVAKARKVWGIIHRTTRGTSVWLSSSFTNLSWFQYLNMHLLYGVPTPRKILKSSS